MAKRSSGLPAGAWVLVADGEKALFLRNIGDAEDMHLDLKDKQEQENPQAQDWAANRPGRFNDGPSAHRSAVDDTDWHELEKTRFAQDLAKDLYSSAQAGEFEALAILASRPVLSELRDKLHQEVTSRIVLEVPKVLTNHPIEEIEQILSKELADAD